MLIAVAVVTVPVAALAFANGVGIDLPFSPLIAPVADFVAPLRSVNRYGLFAVMTTTRPEIVVEGSDDGVEWKAYEFKYKAGDVHRRPPWVAPHQPRLDWQMWFAALGRYDDEPWFQAFCQRLLEGSPAVLALLEHDPFHGRPPREIRAVLYRYRFSDATARRAEGVWWTRERLGLYSPAQPIVIRTEAR
jgi:lipase maturation factor 1